MRFLSPPSRCEYLPDRPWQLEYELVWRLAPAEYMDRLHEGWRRMGSALFRPACDSCRMCQSLRVQVRSFHPARTQARVWKMNRGAITLNIGTPTVTLARQHLFAKFHRFQHHAKQWPVRDADEMKSFTDNPYPTQEWAYSIDDRLVGLGYVDQLPDGLSAVYFFHDPDERRRSLGTFNVLSIIARARELNLPYVYLGYYVEGCRSLEYKARFRPNEILRADGAWTPFVA